MAATAETLDARLQIGRGDPLSRVWESWPWWQVSAAVFVLLTVPKLVLAFVAGHALSPTLAPDVAIDWQTVASGLVKAIRAFPPSHTAATVLGLRTPAWVLAPGVVSSPDIVYLRDYPEMLAMLVGALHTGLVRRQWKRLGWMVQKLRGSGRLVLPDADYERLLVRFGAWSGWTWRTRTAALLAGLTLGLSYFGVFGGRQLFVAFTPAVPDKAVWRTEAFQQWWANWQQPGSEVAVTLFLLSWWLILFYLWMNLYVGLAFVWEFRRLYVIEKARDQQQCLFDLEADHPDGCAGLGEIKSVLGDVVVAVALMTLVIVLAMAYGGGGEVMFAVLWGIVWVFFNSAFLVPLVLAAMILSTFKRQELERLHQEIELLRRRMRSTPRSITPANSGRLAFLEKLYGLAQSMPVSLFSWKHFTGSVAATGAPFVGMITLLHGLSK